VVCGGAPLTTAPRRAAPLTTAPRRAAPLQIPFEDRERAAAVARRFEVDGIPSLIALEARTGRVLTTAGRVALISDPEGLR
jgi:hypothetical protein